MDQKLNSILYPDGLEKVRAEKKNLIQVEVNRDNAYAFSRTRKGGWAIAPSTIPGNYQYC